MIFFLSYFYFYLDYRFSHVSYLEPYNKILYPIYITSFRRLRFFNDRFCCLNDQFKAKDEKKKTFLARKISPLFSSAFPRHRCPPNPKTCSSQICISGRDANDARTFFTRRSFIYFCVILKRGNIILRKDQVAPLDSLRCCRFSNRPPLPSHTADKWKFSGIITSSGLGHQFFRLLRRLRQEAPISAAA